MRTFLKFVYVVCFKRFDHVIPLVVIYGYLSVCSKLFPS